MTPATGADLRVLLCCIVCIMACMLGITATVIMVHADLHASGIIAACRQVRP